MDLKTLKAISPYLNLARLSLAIGQNRATLAMRLHRGSPELTVRESQIIESILSGETEMDRRDA